MPATLLLDTATWDLVLDASGNIAVATEPYSLAQNAASAIKTFLGESYWDTTLGLPYRTDILGKNPPPTLLKALFVRAAMTVPGVKSAKCFLTELSERRLSGQIQVTSEETGQISVADFAVINPQGA